MAASQRKERQVDVVGKSVTKRYIRQILIFAILFLAVTMPFRQLFRLNGLTEVRPAGAFPPVFGLLYGLPGALGCAAGNLIADILSGYPAGICTWGFAAQFLYGLLPHLIWKWWHKEEVSIRLSNVRFVLQYIAIIVINSTVMAFSLGLIMQCLGLGTLFSTGTLLLGFNNISFSLIVGIPIIIGVNVFRRNGSLTLNIQFVLLFLLLSVLSALLLGIVSYTEVMASDVDLMRRWNRIYIQVTLDFFVLWTISMLFLWYLELYIARPIAELTHIARKYADEEAMGQHSQQHIQNEQWAAKCEELGQLHGELGFLAMGFRKMMGDVEQYITELTAATKEKQRIHTELDVAAHIQNGMLPDPCNALPQWESFRISAKMCPAKYVAGDFYDYFLVDEDHAAFLVADVSGKGVPASLFMMVAKTLIHNQVCNGYTVHSVEPDIKHMPELLQEARAVMAARNVLPYTSDSVILAIDELFSNICYYSGARKVSLGIRTPPGCVKLLFEDDGIPFNPLEQKDPDIRKPLCERKQGGLGIFIVTCIADTVKYEYKNNKNKLWVTINN